jgi:probable F420-dependent oxidoreductase
MSPAEDRFVDPAVELERLGFTTIWLTGGSLSELSQVAAVARATGAARIATGIIPVDRFPSEDVAALYVELEREQPGRFVVGLAVRTVRIRSPRSNAHLARLDRVPRDRRVMAALGPRMLELARDRSAGAFPVLVTPQYVGRARGIVDGATTLAVGQLVVLEAEPHRARERARCPDGNNRTATDAIRRNPVPRHRHPPEEARGHGFTEGWGQCLDQLVALMKTH